MPDDSMGVSGPLPQLLAQPAAFVSCDIVGHSTVTDQEVQAARVAAINGLISDAMAQRDADATVWASGGDGGHLIFLDAEWQAAAVELMTALRRWAVGADVPLRITAHAGPVRTLVGADGRVQMVGDGINDAGSILELGSERGMVVSREFAREVEAHVGSLASFHDERPLRTKVREVVLLLMSMPNMPSEWGGDAEDRASLRAAIDRRAAWDALYHAKRILQVNRTDSEVDHLLRRLRPADYAVPARGGRDDGAINPLFGGLTGRALREVIRLGELLERRPNTHICHYGEDADTMFLVLRGQLGVYNVAGGLGPSAGEPSFVLGEGEIAGELSFALSRSRTADLVCLAETGLLTFSYAELEPRLASAPGGADVLANFGRFITSRVLEHVAHAVPFLVGGDRTGPLGGADEPWDSLLEDLLFDCKVTTWSSSEPALTRQALSTREKIDQTHIGVCILAGGSVTSQSNPHKVLEGEDFPTLYVELPGAVLPDHEYVVSRGPAKILRIGAAGIAALPPVTQSKVIGAITAALSSRYYYDAFMSFNFGDEDTVARWRDQLSDAGLRVYLDELQPGVKFTAKIEEALMDSLALLAFISPHTMAKPASQNWVRKEIAFREAHFVTPWIFPVQLRGGDPEKFLLRYTVIDATANEGAAIKRAIAAIKAIREGRSVPPMPSPTRSKRRLQ